VKVKNNLFREINVAGKGLLVLSLALWSVMLISCEDPGILNADKNFNHSNLQTILVDTFSVVTSTVLMDSVPTSNSSVLLVGGYRDSQLGLVSSSTYFQIAYLSNFLPEATSVYDSIALILPYNRYSYGDTTKSFTINIHELSQTIKVRTIPPYVGNKNSILNPVSALYNTSTVKYFPAPIVSATLQFYPHRDSVYIPLPKALGAKWFGIAKADSSFHFKDPIRFISDYFKGIHITSDMGTDASIIGFKANKAKIRLYYRKIVGDILTVVHFDFPVVNGFNQFNHISADRAASPASPLINSVAIPSSSTGNVSYVQSGVGVFTKLEFPTLKEFFKNTNYVLIDALLEVNLVQKTYLNYTKPVVGLSAYVTDQSNILIGALPAGNGILTVPIRYDLEYSLDTKYSFTLTDFINSEIRSNTQNTQLALLSPFATSEVNRAVIGNRFHPTNKIKLKIYYSRYATN
jgi:Domain of unknown function (DUF4270)